MLSNIFYKGNIYMSLICKYIIIFCKWLSCTRFYKSIENWFYQKYNRMINWITIKYKALISRILSLIAYSKNYSFDIKTFFKKTLKNKIINYTYKLKYELSILIRKFLNILLKKFNFDLIQINNSNISLKTDIKNTFFLIKVELSILFLKLLNPEKFTECTKLKNKYIEAKKKLDNAKSKNRNKKGGSFQKKQNEFKVSQKDFKKCIGFYFINDDNNKLLFIEKKTKEKGLTI